MINNFKLIRNFLKFEDSDDFYFLQILQRKKENPHPRLIKTYTIRTPGYLNDHDDEIITLCHLFNARAYINLNRRSYKKVSFKMLTRLSEYLQTEEYPAVAALYASVCGGFTGSKDKTWVVDIDTKNDAYVKTIKEELEALDPIENKILLEVPTKNGIHLITTPFNREIFINAVRARELPPPDIHKNNPTVLYAP